MRAERRIVSDIYSGVRVRYQLVTFYLGHGKWNVVTPAREVHENTARFGDGNPGRHGTAKRRHHFGFSDGALLGQLAESR